MKNYWLLFLLFPFSTPGFCQVRINCCGIDQIIPHFEEDSVFSEESELLLKTKVLTPIKESTSRVEIRIYSSSYGFPGSTLVIRCDNSSFTIDKYETAFNSNIKPDKYPEFFKNYGTVDGYSPKMDLLIWKKDNLNLNNISANDFFHGLIENHFFDSGSQEELNKRVAMAYPNIQITAHGGASIQIKVDGRFRNFINGYFEYAPKPENIKELQYIFNIYDLLDKIK